MAANDTPARSTLPNEDPHRYRGLSKKTFEEYAATFCTCTGPIGAGDSFLVEDVMPQSLAATAFESLKHEVEWQDMMHRSGTVPRLVAVQGTVVDGVAPVYRHPADESPRLRPFSPTVLRIRDELQQSLGQPLNHVLIHLYRGGEDNIREHADKTLDIVRGSVIADVSFGAKRIMTLRTKKDVVLPASDESASQNPLNTRHVQRVPLHHNSLFILGEETNRLYLHGIRADKRPACEKSAEELAFDSERISLTFRHIGTFIDEEHALIWGQGARAKERVRAQVVATQADGEQARAMLEAFGKQNHSSEFDWESEYGCGFDIVDLGTVDIMKTQA